MAFNSGIGAVVPFGNGVGAFNSAQIQTGPNLEEIQTEVGMMNYLSNPES